LDKKQLVIIENKKCWHLYVDVFILQVALANPDNKKPLLYLHFINFLLNNFDYLHNRISGILQPLGVRRHLDRNPRSFSVAEATQTNNFSQLDYRHGRNRPHFREYHFFHHFRYDRVPAALSARRGKIINIIW
jgi:hypothetical protein